MSTIERKPRGRPRQYDPEQALASATGSFWERGYAGTSLDDLAEATGMNRPSLYAAFGDKRSLYLKTLLSYRKRISDAAYCLLDDDPPLEVFLTRFFRGAVTMYLSGPEALGCYPTCTATTEAVADPEIRAFLCESIRLIDTFLAGSIRKGQERGEIGADADPEALARLGTAVLHTLALRSRSGFGREELNAIASSAVAMICQRR